MGSKSSKYYFYTKRYLTRSANRQIIHNTIKGKVLEFITHRIESFRKNTTIKGKIHEFVTHRINSIRMNISMEIYSLDMKSWIQKYNIFIDDIVKSKAPTYNDIRLKEISFFEVIEIDDFEKLRKVILSKFGNSMDFIGRNRKEELQKKLDNLESKFDQTSSGSLFSINYTKKKSSKCDLIESISCQYIKTNESYFILSFDVHLSAKSVEIANQILQQKDVGISFLEYNTYLNVLKKKSFYSCEIFNSSLKSYNLENFISDLSYQVKYNITKHLGGYFHKSKILNVLPNIQLFEVDDIQKFHEDKILKSIFKTSFDKYYSLDDELVEIHFSDSWNNEQEVIQIIQQKGHGNKDKKDNENTDWDRLENYYLIKSLSFPCVFSAILREQRYKLNTLKRQIYDQIKLSGNNYILKHFLLLGVNKKYLELKYSSIQILLTIKRFENEFTDRKIQLYTRFADLQEFKARNVREKEEKNLLLHFIKAFRFEINSLDSNTKSLNDVFKSLEELNSYKTNFILQLFSIFVAILAFVFTFDKTKTLIMDIIKHIWR